MTLFLRQGTYSIHLPFYRLMILAKMSLTGSLMRKGVIAKKKMAGCCHSSLNKTTMSCYELKRQWLTVHMPISCKLKLVMCPMKILSQQPHLHMVFSIHILPRAILILIFCFPSVPASSISHWKQDNGSLSRLMAGTILLGVPSAFEIGLNHCRWIYKHGDHCFQVRTWTSKKGPQVNMDFKVISGNNVRLVNYPSF